MEIVIGLLVIGLFLTIYSLIKDTEFLDYFLEGCVYTSALLIFLFIAWGLGKLLIVLFT
jgi:hypothetical protein